MPEQPLLAVDAGNLLFKKALTGAGDTDNTTAQITAYGLIRAYKHMAYDAVAVSSNDLSAGTEFFRRSNDESFPWVAANIYDQNNELLFLPHIIKKTGSLTIGIIGLTGGAENNFEYFVIADWRKALRAQIAVLETSCDMLVVLSNLTTAENNEIQQSFNEIDVVIAADKQGRNIQPQVAKNILIAQSGGRGKYIGKLDITWHGDGSWSTATSQSVAYQENRIRTIDFQLNQLQKQQDIPSRYVSQKIARLQAIRQIISTQIAQQTTAGKTQQNLPGKSFKYSFLPVKPRPSGDKIDTIVQDIKKNIDTFNKYRRSNLQLDTSDIRLALQKDEIAGASSCFSCHVKQADFWKNTRHAKAYTTLSRQGQSFNLQCLPCHVTAGKISTGSVESKSLFLLTLGGDRQTIGCEVCHGPGRQHLLSPDEVTPARLPAEEVCRSCHTPERDSNFNYRRKLAAIACPAD